MLLEAQAWIRANSPAHVKSLELITLAELEEIRRIWVVDKHEFEDRLPVIYVEATGSPYPRRPLDEHLPLNAGTIEVLQEITGEDRLHLEMVRELLDISNSATAPRPAALACSRPWRKRCAAAFTTTRPTPPAVPSTGRKR